MVLSLAAVAVMIPGFRYLAALDPWAALEDADYLEPFGPGVGSVITDVEVVSYQRADRVASFSADRIELRRDQQFMRLIGINRGVLFDRNAPSAEFTAELATYDVKRGYASVSGPATLKNKDFDLKAANLTLDRKRQTVKVDSEIRGTFRGGDLVAADLELNYAKREAKTGPLKWTGPAGELTGAQGQKRRLSIRGSGMETFANPDREVYTDAEVVDDESLMRAEKVTWDKEKDVITAEGNVEYYGPDAVITGPTLVVFRKEKRAVGTGAIRILVKPEKDKGDVGAAPPLPPMPPKLPPGLRQPTGPPQTDQDAEDELRDPKSVRRYPITITCSKVEYFYAKGSKRAVLTGSPRAFQELKAGAWREIAAPSAVYEEEKELLTLNSSPGGKEVRMKNSNGDDLRAESVVISTVQGQERVVAKHIEGTVIVRDEEGGGGGSSPPKRSGSP